MGPDTREIIPNYLITAWISAKWCSENREELLKVWIEAIFKNNSNRISVRLWIGMFCFLSWVLVCLGFLRTQLRYSEQWNASWQCSSRVLMTGRAQHFNSLAYLIPEIRTPLGNQMIVIKAIKFSSRTYVKSNPSQTLNGKWCSLAHTKNSVKCQHCCLRLFSPTQRVIIKIIFTRTRKMRR